MSKEFIDGCIVTTVYLKPDIYDYLRLRAFDTSTSRNEIIDDLIRRGIESLKKEDKND